MAVTTAAGAAAAPWLNPWNFAVGAEATTAMRVMAETANASRTDFMDVSESEDYTDIEAEYSADQATRDQERAEEDEEMVARASTFPADKETAYTRPTIFFLCMCLSRISELETVLLKSLPFFNHSHH